MHSVAFVFILFKSGYSVTVQFSCGQFMSYLDLDGQAVC
jgi:hypothetical protein